VGLLDELTALEHARRPGGGVQCRIATILDGMSAEEGQALRHLIDATDTYGTMIARTLAAHGYQVNASQIGHHRRRVRGGGCSCPLPDEVA
jgi:hypothetical protein